MITIILPIPPSLHQLYGVKKGGGKYLTSAYRAWRREADWRIAEQRAQKSAIVGPYTFQLTLPMHCRLDPDNALKAPMDLLVRWNITADDRHCKSATAVKSRDLTGNDCVVTIAEWGTA